MGPSVSRAFGSDYFRTLLMLDSQGIVSCKRLVRDISGQAKCCSGRRNVFEKCEEVAMVRVTAAIGFLVDFQRIGHHKRRLCGCVVGIGKIVF